MNRIILCISIFVMAMLIGCESNENSDLKSANDSLIGCWVQADLHISDTAVIYFRANKLQDDKPGFIFNSDSTLTERQNSGWCGTPPISYANFEGIYNKINQDTYFVSVGYWGGITTYSFKILSLTSDTLKIIHIFAEN